MAKATHYILKLVLISLFYTKCFAAINTTKAAKIFDLSDPNAFAAKIDEQSESHPKNSIRVIGGRNATEGEFPYQVSLRKAKMVHYCGGCLIDKEWVLTAAHCLANRPIAVTMGSIYLHNNFTNMSVSKTFVHPEYDRAKRLNDIGLIKLSASVEFNSNTQALALPNADIDVDTTVQLTGWGYTDFTKKILPEILQVIDIKTIDNSDCSDKWKPYTIHPSNLCTGSPPGKGVCQGDSGGPLAANGIIHGIVSYGTACALGYPDVFTRIYSMLDWIKSTMENNQ